MPTQQLNRLAGLLKSAYSATRLTEDSDADLLARCRRASDPAAFEAIVRRHGGTVLAACRKVLSDSADVDDAFQATFLVLLQKPAALRNKHALGSWLYGVAHRIAVRARNTSARRLAILKKGPAPSDQAPAGPDLSWKEACGVLHAELDRLPEALRQPLLLCYLEGQSRDEAAKTLGWTLNEVRGRLERGRDRLRRRLEKRGITLSAGLMAAAAGGDSVTAGGPPARLVESVLRAASGSPSPAAAALAHGASAMSAKFKLLATVILAVGCVIAAGVRDPGLYAGPAGDPPKAASPAGTDKPPADEMLTFEGRVLGPSDKPVAGAKLHVLYYTPKALTIPVRETSDKDGRFRFTMKKTDFDPTYTPTPWRGLHVLARADGFAVGWAVTDEMKTSAADLTIRLPADDKPLTGRFVNLEGKPLAGITVGLKGLMRPKDGKTDLSSLVGELKEKGVGYPVERNHVMGFEGSWIGRDLGMLFPTATSDAEGKFTIPGIGPERVAVLQISGPRVESRSVRVLTRNAETLTVPEWDRDRPAPGMENPTTMTYLGQGTDIALAPGRTVTGVIKDAASGKPIPGCRIVTEKLANQTVHGRHEWQAVSDKDGKYTLTGLPLAKGNILRAAPPAGQPYLMQLRNVPVPEGFNPAPLDFEMVRGVALDIKAVDAVSGKGVAGRFDYFLFLDDPTYRKIPGFTMPHGIETEAEDGTVRLIVPATSGMIAFRSLGDNYPVGVGADQFKDRSRGPLIQTAPHLCHATNYNLLQAVEIKDGEQVKTVTLKLDRGKAVKGRVLDPDGKPLTGCLVRGLKSSPSVFGLWETEPMKSAEFEAYGIGPDKPRAVAFVHKEKKLAGTARVSGNEKAAIEVKLVPWATVTGRLVDGDGKPMADVRLGFVSGIEEPDPAGIGDLPDHEVRTDANGRFTLVGFAPGVRYHLAALGRSRIIAAVGNDLQFKAGENKDVGDVVGKKFD